MPTHQRSWDGPQQRHHHPRSAPESSPPGTGSVSKLRWAVLPGLILWTSGITKRALITYPCNWLCLLNRLSTSHFSHNSHSTRPCPRHHHLSPDYYTALLTHVPASTLDPKHHGSVRRCWCSQLPEKSTVIPKEMDYRDLPVPNSSSKGKKRMLEMFPFCPNN